MRLSIDKDDPGYSPLYSHQVAVKIYLNGALIQNVITADEELGFVEHYKVYPFNVCGMDKGEAVSETLYGKVEIRFS